MLTATFKVCIFGDGGVGKTTLIQRYINGRFQQNTKMTIGVDISVKHLFIGNYKIHLQIWDFGGEERFRFFLPSYASGSFGGVFMYDTTRYSSLMDLEEWLTVFKKSIRYNENPIPIIMIGGKADMIDQKNIQYEDAVKFAELNKISKVFECSSKTGENVELIFNTLTIDIMKNVALIN